MAATATPRLGLKFDAIYYHVSDMDRAIAFYRDTLGIPLVSRDYVARFDLDGVLFELVPNPAEKIPGTGNARLSLETRDIYATCRALEAKGVGTTPVKKEPGGLLALFHDPDGNELCLWQYA